MFELIVIFLVPAIFGLAFVGIFVGVIVFIITHSVRDAKREVNEGKLREFENVNMGEFRKLENRKCEYCGGEIEVSQDECPSCGAKVPKQ